MNEMDKWDELCFILSESINSNISEQLYELKVIQAFEKLGWSQYKKEISVRESIQFGAAGRITPDLIIKSQGKNLFVVEIKKPSANIDNSGFKDQLYSYMRMLKLNFGILIGSKIQIYYDGNKFGNKDFILLDEIEYKSNNPKGLEFVELFDKSKFNEINLENYINKKLSKIQNIELIQKLKKELKSGDISLLVKKLLKIEMKGRYNNTVIDNVFKNIEIKVHYNLQEKKEKDITPSITIPKEIEIITLPRLSDTMKEATVISWNKKIGDIIKEGDIIAKIKTEIATMEFESFYTGELLAIGIKEGETALIDTVLAIIGPKGTNVSGIIESFNTSSDFSVINKKKTNERIKKKEAISIINTYLYNINQSTILNKNTVYSNKNSANDKWWFEPSPNMFKQNFNLVLNDYKTKKLFLFEIPKNDFNLLDNFFYYRSEVNRYSIRIEGNDTKYFEDELGNLNKVKFIKYLIHTISY